MKNLIKEYFTNESGKEEIVTIIMTILGLASALAVGWWVWNVLKGQTTEAEKKCDSPFCIGR